MNNLRSRFEQLRGKRDGFIESLEEQEKKLKILKRDFRNTEEALPIAQYVAKKTQSQLELEISEIVTLALESVFDDPYEFKVEFVVRRGKTEADLKFIKNGVERDPLAEAGYGAVDVAALALRVALWNINPHKLRNTIVLDEPMKFLSMDLQAKAGEMLKMLSKQLNIQFIIITHNDDLIDAADKLFTVSQRKNISRVEVTK